MEEVDCLSTLPTDMVKWDQGGFVRLVDAMPRLVPVGRTPEFAVVRSARVSYGLGLKSIEEDKKLLRYLIKNQHTSPLESVKFTFHIRAPLFVAVHFLRHRTANINMFSARYAEVPGEDNYYHISQNPLRLQSKTNKQAGDVVSDDSALLEAVKETEDLLDKVFSQYHKLVDLGLAKELARFCLPEARYTEFYFTMDLNNLLKFLRLRDDSHAQLETQIYARAMKDLIRPLLPTVFEVCEM